jgi:hypothetical protein
VGESLNEILDLERTTEGFRTLTVAKASGEGQTLLTMTDMHAREKPPR